MLYNVLFALSLSQGEIILRGIRNVKMYAREIVASAGSKIDFSAPNWNQVYERRVVSGSNGENGNHGTSGPQGELTDFSLPS